MVIFILWLSPIVEKLQVLVPKKIKVSVLVLTINSEVINIKLRSAH